MTCLFPFIEAIGQDEMAPAFAAIDDTTGLVLDRGYVVGADAALPVDPDGGDAGGAKVIFRDELVAR